MGSGPCIWNNADSFNQNYTRMKNCKKHDCNQSFTPRRNWQQYCSDKCRKADFTLRSKSENEKLLFYSLAINFISLIALITTIYKT